MKNEPCPSLGQYGAGAPSCQGQNRVLLCRHMATIQRFFLPAVIIFSFAAMLAFAASASANHAWTNSSGQAYHWARTSNPFTLKLGDNVNSVAWDASLALASTDWTVSTVLNTTVVLGGTNAAKGKNTPKNCTPTSGRGEVCNSNYGNNGWLGIATIWASGVHITQGTVKVNDTYFNTPSYNTPAWRNLVMCQEVGHIFGLGHQDENFGNTPLGTCMDYSNDPEPNQHPNAHDYAMLEQIYAHPDSGTTLSQTTTQNGRGNGTWVDVDSAIPSAWV